MKKIAMMRISCNTDGTSDGEVFGLGVYNTCMTHSFLPAPTLILRMLNMEASLSGSLILQIILVQLSSYEELLIHDIAKE